MKRMVILVAALGMVTCGLMMGGNDALAENSSGNHFVKGRVVAIEACYANEIHVNGSCLGVIESNGVKHPGKIIGDASIDKTVYQECEVSGGVTQCSKNWGTSVGEAYLKGGEISR